MRAWLPTGNTLPDGPWAARHRAMVVILALHVPAFLTIGLIQGHSIPHALGDVIPLAVALFFATRPQLKRVPREAFVAVGLLSGSAVLIHLMHGAIEAHFHFFISVALLALYEEWFVYLLAFVFVLVHHILMSAIAPDSVFSHPAAQAHPWEWSIIHAIFIAAQGFICLVGWKMNEDARRHATESKERFSRAFDDAPIGMALVGLDGTIREANNSLIERWDAAGDGTQLAGHRLAELVDEGELEGRAFPGADATEIRHADNSGWGHWRHAPLHAEDGTHTGWISHIIDVTTRRRLEDDLSWRAHHDALTGLPNRQLLLRCLEDGLSADKGMSVFFIDLDDFKLINDTLGHAAGDELLRSVAERLTATMRPEDVVARLGGDEFVVLAQGVTTGEGAQRVAERVRTALQQPVLLAGDDRYIGGSIGLRVCRPKEQASPDEVLRDADIAMYRAKRLGKGGFELFDAALHEADAGRLAIEGALHTAVERHEFELAYQPIVELSTERTVAVEALIRWYHPQLGFVSPMDFIPLAERNGTIVEIGAWVLNEAVRQLIEWADDALVISVNVSSRQLALPGFADTVRATIERHGIAPERLCLEVTETAVLSDLNATVGTMEDLVALGVRLAVDDFGVGAASLQHLRQLMPVDTLKIDKSFIDGIVTDPINSAITRSVIGLAKALDLAVVAEGVEDAEQAEVLRAWGCQTVQGYHFSRPIPADEIGARLAAEKADLRRAA